MLEIVPLLLASFYLGWNIGANDSANCAGTSIGSRLISYRRAAILVAAFALVGSLTAGQAVVETVGTGIVAQELPREVILVAMASAGGCVTLATLLRLPISTSQAVVGGVAGVGLAVGAEVNFSVLLRIVEAWVLSPFLAALFSVFLYHLFARPLRLIRRIGALDRVLSWLVVASVGYAAFSLGANNVGNAIGPLANVGLRAPWIALLGGLALAVGGLSFGHRVTKTVAHGVVPFDPLSAFAVQTSLAIVTHLFAVAGIPISLSQAVVGALMGIGLVKGVRVVSRAKVLAIAVAWVATPAIAGLLAFGLSALLA